MSKFVTVQNAFVSLLTAVIMVMLMVGFVWAKAQYDATVGKVDAAVATVTAAVAPAPEQTEVTREVIVQSLQGKFEVITVALPVETYTVAGRCEGNAWQQFAFKNCVTMLVPAVVSAGFDWSGFGTDDISTTSETVTIHLGQTKIFAVNITEEKVRPLGHEDGWLVWRDETLQVRALAQAKKELRVKACSIEILQRAELEAKVRVGDVLRAILKAAGDTRTVEVVFAPAHC